MSLISLLNTSEIETVSDLPREIDMSDAPREYGKKSYNMWAEMWGIGTSVASSAGRVRQIY
jgi:hypothetical protein